MKFFLTVIIVLAAITAGGAAFLSQWEIPVPRQEVERPISNDRFSQ